MRRHCWQFDIGNPTKDKRSCRTLALAFALRSNIARSGLGGGGGDNDGALIVLRVARLGVHQGCRAQASARATLARSSASARRTTARLARLCRRRRRRRGAQSNLMDTFEASLSLPRPFGRNVSHLLTPTVLARKRPDRPMTPFSSSSFNVMRVEAKEATQSAVVDNAADSCALVATTSGGALMQSSCFICKSRATPSTQTQPQPLGFARTR